MATEEILMAAVQKGGDRQKIHEKIRDAAVESAKLVKMEGKPNDLLARLAQDASFAQINFSELLNAKNFIGRASEQVQVFIDAQVRPCRQRYAGTGNQSAELHI